MPQAALVQNYSVTAGVAITNHRLLVKSDGTGYVIEKAGTDGVGEPSWSTVATITRGSTSSVPIAADALIALLDALTGAGG